MDLKKMDLGLEFILLRTGVEGTLHNVIYEIGIKHQIEYSLYIWFKVGFLPRRYPYHKITIALKFS